MNAQQWLKDYFSNVNLPYNAKYSAGLSSLDNGMACYNVDKWPFVIVEKNIDRRMLHALIHSRTISTEYDAPGLINLVPKLYQQPYELLAASISVDKNVFVYYGSHEDIIAAMIEQKDVFCLPQEFTWRSEAAEQDATSVIQYWEALYNSLVLEGYIYPIGTGVNQIHLVQPVGAEDGDPYMEIIDLVDTVSIDPDLYVYSLEYLNKLRQSYCTLVKKVYATYKDFELAVQYNEMKRSSSLLDTERQNVARLTKDLEAANLTGGITVGVEIKDRLSW